MSRKVPLIRLVVLAAVLIPAAGCRPSNIALVPTPSPTVESVSYGPLAARAFVTPENFHWVDLQGEFLLDASEVAESHRIALRDYGVEFTNDPRPMVSPDETKALAGVRSADGRPGVLLIRSDGTSMAMYVFRDRTTTFGSVGFAPWVGMTMIGARDSTGSRVVAINNYAGMQFQLEVQDHTGEVLVAPDLGYVALVRDGEIELAPLDTPGETTIIRDGSTSPDGRDLYQDALRLVSRWR